MADDPITETPTDEAFDYVGSVRLLIGDSQGKVGSDLLDLLVSRAKALILNRRHPYSDDPQAEPWESRYDHLVCEVAAYFWFKMGAEGQTASRENGIYRAWDQDDAYVPSGLLCRVVPIAAVP